MAAKNLGTSGVLYTDRRDFYPEPLEVAELYPNLTPFLSMMAAKGKRMTKDADFKLFEHRSGFRYTYFDVNDSTSLTWSSSGEPGATATITVDNPNGVSVDSSLVGSTVEVWSEGLTTYKGHALITAVSSNDVTFKSLGKRDQASFQNSAFEDNDRVFVLHYAGGEGTTAPEARNDELEVVWNSCYDERTAVHITTALAKAALRGERDELARLRKEAYKHHKAKQERAIWFGMRPGGIGGTANNAGGGSDSTFINHQTDAGSNTVRTTMGLVTALERYGNTTGDQQNLFTINEASYSYANFVDDMEKVFQYEPEGGRKVAFCGPGALAYWNKLTMQEKSGWDINISADSMQSKIGVNYRILEAGGQGELALVKVPLWRGTPYNNYMVVCMEEHVELRNFEEADAFYANIKRDDNPRGIKDEYYSNLGLGIRLMESHSRFKIV